MEEIKVGEYVRTKYGEIFKVIHLTKQKERYVIVDRYVDRNEDRAENDNTLNITDIVKHRLDIKDLIEESDILEIEISKEWTDDENRIKIIAVGPTFTKQNIIRDIENGLYKIKAITTAEQFNQVKYEV